MGGTSSSENKQSSTTAPWAPAQPALQGILSQLQNYTNNPGITQGETNALNGIIGNAGGTAKFTPAIDASTASLLAGGGALSQAPAVQAAYDQFGKNTSGLANNTDYNPMNTPGIGDQLQALKDQITTGINGQFASAGRLGSAYDQKAVAQGLAAGLAPVITGQYNQNVQNQQGAAKSIYDAAMGNAGLMSGLQQQYVANQQAGVNQVPTGLQAQNSGPGAILAAELQRQGIPINNLGLLANIGVPIAGLGGQSTGQSNTTNQMSGAQQFASIVSPFTQMFKFGGG